MTAPLLRAAARSIMGSTPGPPDCLHLSPSYGHRRATKGWQRPWEAQKGVRSYRNQALWVVLRRGCLPAIAGRVHSGWMVSCEAFYLHRDATGEGAKQLKRNTDILVQHRERRGNYREVSACKPGFLCSKNVKLHFEDG